MALHVKRFEFESAANVYRILDGDASCVFPGPSSWANSVCCVFASDAVIQVSVTAAFRNVVGTYKKNNASGCLCQSGTQHHHRPCSVVCHCSDDLDRTSECQCTAREEETSSFSSVRYQKPNSSHVRHSFRLCPSCVL
jgi:hypothetical protein